MSSGVPLNNTLIPQSDTATYLGLHLDRRLTWRAHILAKRKQLNCKFQKLYWLLSKTSKLRTENKLLIYKAAIKPIWSYGIQLWGTSSHSNIEILQRFQSKILRTIVKAPWYVSNAIIHRDLMCPTVHEVIKHFGQSYGMRLEHHQNPEAINLLDNSTTVRRLRRLHPLDLI